MSLLLSRWAKLYNGTVSELSMEPAIAALGIPYRFQHPVWGMGCFLDYAWPSMKLALEIDGKEHNTKAGREKDLDRTTRLGRFGWTVIRCTNEDAQHNIPVVLEKIKAAMAKLQKDQA